MKTSKNVELSVNEEQVEHLGALNQIITVTTKRPDGSLRIQQDFQLCPTMAEQHTAHLSDINYLIEKYKPDELSAYLAARTQHRQEILGHDFSKEPTLQEAKNIVLESKNAFLALPEEVRRNFSNHLEFLKFIDNPANAEKLIKLGIATKRELEKIQIPEDPNLSHNQIQTETKSTTSKTKQNTID